MDLLLERWLPLNTGAGRYVYVEEDYALARECVESLGCGEELIRLIEALQLQDAQIDSVFHLVVKQHLHTASDIRTEMSGIAAISSDPAIRTRWSLYAGAVASDAEHKAFVGLLSSELDRNASQLGQFVRLGETDPATALVQASNILKSGNFDTLAGEVIGSILTASKDPAAFPAKMKALNSLPEIPNTNVISHSTGSLLTAWMHADGPSLVAQVNATPSEFDATELAAAMVNWTDLEKGLALAQDLKSTEHFDAVARALLPRLKTLYPKQAEELAGQITASEIKESARKFLDSPPDNSDAH